MLLHIFDNIRHGMAIQKHENHSGKNEVIIFLNIGRIDVIKCGLNW